MAGRYADKAAARGAVWDRLVERKAAAFPFPPHGRIPNFKGSAEAARRLFTIPLFRYARRLKCNPDSAQRAVREEALRRGIVVYVPTPRLAGDFKKLDPAKIPRERLRDAATISKGAAWAEDVALDGLPPMDAIVCGSVAVSRDGRRAGKGEGYADREYAILRELGHPPAPVATTVHPLQLVDVLPASPHDLPLAWIVTPDEVVAVADPPPAPAGIDWSALRTADYDEMPVLRELRRLLDE
jgi:5-formyltetrahydrofolate cyclo-ligase